MIQNIVCPPGVYRPTSKPAIWLRLRHKIWRRLCRYIFSPVFLYLQVDHPYVELLYKEAKNEKPEFVSTRYRTRIDIDVGDASVGSRFSYPFKKIASFLKRKDIVWANLETPLSNSTRPYGFFISDPRYAKTIKDAGITMICMANNHIFDAGELGFEDTIKHLDQAGIPYTGAGRNFENARSGKLLQEKDLKIGFLS